MSPTKRRACSKSKMSADPVPILLSRVIPIFRDMDADSRTNLLTYLHQLDALLAIPGSIPAWLHEPTRKKPSAAHKTAGFSGSSKTKR